MAKKSLNPIVAVGAGQDALPESQPTTSTPTVIPTDDVSEGANANVDTLGRTDTPATKEQSSSVPTQAASDDLNVAVSEDDTKATTVTHPPAHPAKVDLLADAVARQAYLDGQTQRFRQIERAAFATYEDMGRILYESWKALKEDDDSWVDWVVNDLGLSVRTAQRLRGLYALGNGKEQLVPPVASEYRQEVGPTKMDLFWTLHKAGAQKRATKGVTKFTITATSITFTVTTKNADGDDVSTTYDAADPAVTVRMLRDLMPEANKTTAASDPESDKAKLKALRAENQQLKDDVKQLESDNETLQQHAANVEMTSHRLLEEVEVLREEVESLREQLAAQHDDAFATSEA